MASEAAALLDELMGAQRNALPGEKVRETRWSDPEVIFGALHTQSCAILSLFLF